MKKLIFSLILSNLSGLLVFYLMYRVGIKLNIPLVEKYYIIPLAFVLTFMSWDNYNDIKRLKLQNN